MSLEGIRQLHMTALQARLSVAVTGIHLNVNDKQKETAELMHEAKQLAEQLQVRDAGVLAGRAWNHPGYLVE